MMWEKFKREFEFYSTINPIAFIVGLLIGTILLLTLFAVFRERKVISIMSKITATILIMLYVSIFIMLFYANNSILGKVIVAALFSFILYLFYRSKLRNKRACKKRNH